MWYPIKALGALPLISYRGVEQLVARRAHNPEVAGSSPVSATRSVTVVDTISTTVIFYFLLLCRQFLRENRDFQNISAVEQTVKSHLPQLGVPKARLVRIAIVIRIQTINYYFLYTQNRPWLGVISDMDGFLLIPMGQKGQNRTAESFLPPLGLRLTAYGI